MSSSVAQAAHSITFRVRYPEVDRMDRVHHSYYLHYFEMGRTDFLRDAGLPYRVLEDKDLLLPVVSLDIRYLAPASYDDELTLRTELVKAKGARIIFSYAVEGPLGLLATGSSEHALVNRAGRPTRIPPFLLDKLQG